MNTEDFAYRYAYRIFRDAHGDWQGETMINLSPDLVLLITTRKRKKGVGCFASVHHREGMFLTHRMLKDYSREIAKQVGRATEKLIAHVHQTGLDTVPTILLDVRAQYGLLEAA
jgi:hypothetical protein